MHDNPYLFKVYREPKQLQKIVHTLKELGNKVVLINGVFDLLHFGHLEYIWKAKKFGEILIVAINDDEYIKNYKKREPANNLLFRMALLASLKQVDYIVSFSEETPEKITRLIKPTILVQGAEYRWNSKWTKNTGCPVRYIRRVSDESTSKLIDKIRGNSFQYD